jgi:hypothetical protein
VWATTELPIDLELLDTLLLNLRLIYNRDGAYRTELEKIRGAQLRMEGQQGMLFGKRYIDEVVEISQRTPPPGTYEPPAGYRRVDRLDL